MGLDISHGAFSGAYSSFNRLRQMVAKVIGGSFPPHDRSLPEHAGKMDFQWYWGPGFGPMTHPGLHAFLAHSDCDGEIEPSTASLLADELETLLPRIDQVGDGGGHIARDGGYGAVVRRLIQGCRDAAAAGESLEFH